MFFSNRRFASLKKRSGFNIARNYSEVIFRIFENSPGSSKESTYSRQMMAAGLISNNIRSMDSTEGNI